jgi:nucleotide-binding universal stress UspA family protein
MSTGVFRRVLVPVELEAADPEPTGDGSIATDRIEIGDHSWVGVGMWTAHALELAARLVGDGELWVVHATHDFTQYATWMPPARISELDHSASHHTRAVLEAVVAVHCPDAELHYAIRPGKAVDVILAVARQHPPDAIVLAASARSRIQRVFMGSTADKVIRRASCPVVVVPPAVG